MRLHQASFRIVRNRSAVAIRPLHFEITTDIQKNFCVKNTKQNQFQIDKIEVSNIDFKMVSANIYQNILKINRLSGG